MVYSDDWEYFRTNFSSFFVRFIWNTETNMPTKMIVVSRLVNKNIIFSEGNSLEEIRLDTAKQLEIINR